MRLETLIENVTGDTDLDVVDTLGPKRFAENRSAAVERDLSLTGLAPGPHLLTVRATLGKNTYTRAVRFAMK